MVTMAKKMPFGKKAVKGPKPEKMCAKCKKPAGKCKC